MDALNSIVRAIIMVWVAVIIATIIAGAAGLVSLHTGVWVIAVAWCVVAVYRLINWSQPRW